jgi:hypothetical protein
MMAYFSNLSFAFKSYLFVLLAGIMFIIPLAIGLSPQKHSGDTVYTSLYTYKLDNIKSLSLIGASIMVPAMIEQILDIMYYESNSANSIRLSFTVFGFLSFLAQHIISSAFENKIILFGIIMDFQFSLVLGMCAVYLHSKLQIVIYKDRFLVAMGIFFYSGILFNYIYLYADDGSHSFLSVLSQISIIFYFVLAILFNLTAIIKLLFLWRSSAKSFSAWYRAIPLHLKDQIHASCGGLVVTLILTFMYSRQVALWSDQIIPLVRLVVVILVSLVMTVTLSRRARIDRDSFHNELVGNSFYLLELYCTSLRVLSFINIIL